MPFSKEDKALTTNLYQFTGHLSESIYISVLGVQPVKIFGLWSLHVPIIAPYAQSVMCVD